jgi:hypothetical protein
MCLLFCNFREIEVGQVDEWDVVKKIKTVLLNMFVKNLSEINNPMIVDFLEGFIFFFFF